MENVKLYSICFLNVQLVILLFVLTVPVKKRTRKTICLASMIAGYTWAFSLFYLYLIPDGCWVMLTYNPKGEPSIRSPGYFFYYDDSLFAMYTILFLIVTYVEYKTMPLKNEEIKKLGRRKQVMRWLSEKFSKIVTLLFLGVQFHLSDAIFWFYFLEF
jgi:hypothetical protein